jgi:hypothetical protein
MILRDLRDLFRSLLHRLEQHHVARDMFADQVEREQRMAQVVEHAHEDHEIELLTQRADIVDRQVAELDIIDTECRGGKTRLRQIAVVAIDAEHAVRATPLHLDRIEAGVAADVEHALAGEIGRQCRRETTIFEAGIIAQEMVRRGPQPITQIDVLEPGRERLDLGLQVATWIV